MINPERLLGQLVRGSMRGGMRSVNPAVVGMGLLGVAIAAIEHFGQAREAGGPPPLPPPLPPPPGPGAQAAPATQPPPPPASSAAGGWASGEPAPPLDRQQEAMLLVRAMIAAAAADAQVDEAERARIFERLGAAGLGPEDEAALAAELERPLPPEALASLVTGPELAEQVYAASLLAVRVDTAAERDHLARLAALLRLDPPTVDRLHRLFGV